MITTNHFVPLSQVKDVLLLEGITGWSISWWLSVLVETSGSEASAEGVDARVKSLVLFDVRASSLWPASCHLV